MQADAYTQDDDLDGNPAPEEKIRQFRDQLLAQVDQFGAELAKTRSDAIEARQASGIEADWLEDEEFYEGIDDANRNEKHGFSSKPVSPTGGSADPVKPTGSTVFPNITRPYVDAASARVSDMLLPTDDKSWSIEPTPVPELVGIAKGEFSREVEQQMQASFNDPQALAAEKSRLTAEIEQQIAIAREKASATERRIQDWHIESQYHAHAREQIEDCARIGTGVLKGPVASRRKKTAYKDGQIIITSEIKPVSSCVSPWNCYPDGGCGQDIQNGSYHWERDDITRMKLEALKDQPGYIAEAVDACLFEGPHEACKLKEGQEIPGLQKRDTKDLFEIWYGYCTAEKQKFVAALNAGEDTPVGEDGEPSLAEPGDAYPEQIHVHVVMVNNRVIRISQNILDTGEFPYDYMVWQRRKDSPWGIGIARQVRTAQRIVIAGFRNMMDNGGMASGPQVIVNREYVQPMDGIYSIESWKFWDMVKDLDGNMDMDNVFRFVTVSMYQAEMQAIIELGLRLAEDATGLPMIMQGQTNSATPDTLGGMQIQNDNASTVLRRIARLYDDRVTERHIRRYYTFHLQYGPDDEKGDFALNAMGSSALVERAIQAQQMPFILKMSENSVYGLDPKKVGEEQVKAMRFDYNRFKFDDEKWQQVVEQLAQKPQNPILEVTQIRESGQTQRKQMELESRENTAAYQAMNQQELQTQQQQFELLMSDVSQDVTAFIESMENGRLDKTLKAKLAEAAAKLKAQMQMNAQVITPPTEPAGRAPDGQAFQK